MKTFITLLIIIGLGVGAFFYFTRPIAAPTQDIQSVSEQVTENKSANAKTYRVVQSKSKISFSAQETLNGKPFTAVGTTNQVAADIVIAEGVDKAPEVTVGVIKIDARTFKTDSEKRDGAINRFILQTETAGNEYIVFTPKSVSGPTSITSGKEFSFTVMGDLTISGITKPAVLAVTATQTDDVLTGTAKTSFKRSDYNLKIPSIPFVANVADEIPVTGTFTATAVVEEETKTPVLE